MDSEGGGFPEKTMSVHKGEGVLEAGPRGQKFSYTTSLTYSMLYCCVNLVFSCEQLHYEFLL